MIRTFGNLPRRKQFGKIGRALRRISDDGASFGNFCWKVGERRVCLINKSLNNLQKDFLREFFKRENHFFLSGGAALVGFYFGHRETRDLDLFTLEDEIENGFRLVNEVAKKLNGAVESIQTAPDFRRLLIRRQTESIVVDLIREYVFQIDREKREINGIRIDSPEEILANKLCALLSRSEIRDLIDVRELENAGFSLENALVAAAKKDTGLTASQLAWVLHQIKLGDDLILPHDISVADLRNYLQNLIGRLTDLGFPE